MQKFTVILLLGFILSSCASLPSQQANGSAQLTSNITASGEIANTPEPSRTFTPSPSLSDTPKPTSTEIPSAVPSHTATTPLCVNQAEFVRHLSVSENSKMPIGTFFAKVWRVKNTGTCSWDSGYHFVFDDGDAMSSPPEVPLPREVLPGETVDIQVVLVTPMEPNTYAGYWMLRDPAGQVFGSGEDGSQPFAAIVVVEAVKINERRETFACG
jgi:hypothetical protein